MGIRRKVGRSGAVVAAVLLAAGTLVLPSSSQPAVSQASQPAVAQDACTPSEIVEFPHWTTVYDDRGVTLCRGFFDPPSGSLDPDAMVQIVDLDAGAKLRLISDYCEPSEFDCPVSDPTRKTDLQYHKRLAHEWLGWAKSNIDWPPSGLFSTTNASFFTDTSASTTALSLPEYHTIVNGYPTSGTAQYSWGWAFFHHEDPAWDALKLALTIGNAKISPQEVSIDHFPTNPTDQDVGAVLFADNWGDATVAFRPLEGGGTSRRTFMGVDSIAGDVSKVYILTTSINVTLSQAQNILKAFGSFLEMQLDGGSSAQMHYEEPAGGGGGIPSLIGREVPDVLGVYLAPE